MDADLEDLVDGQHDVPTGMDSCLADPQPPIGPYDPQRSGHLHPPTAATAGSRSGSAALA
ncbi:MAG TPA: hypothetical protein VGD71_20465 [Kribbella sp.]|jgi:hypothetical protein